MVLLSRSDSNSKSKARKSRSLSREKSRSKSPVKETKNGKARYESRYLLCNKQILILVGKTCFTVPLELKVSSQAIEESYYVSIRTTVEDTREVPAGDPNKLGRGAP